MRQCDGAEAKHASVPLRRVRAGEVRVRTSLYELKAGPAGGRLRRPSSAGDDRTGAGEPVSPSTPGRGEGAVCAGVPEARLLRFTLPGDAAPSSTGERGKQRTLRLAVDRRRRGSRRRGDGD
jgi:hypothetical protein